MHTEQRSCAAASDADLRLRASPICFMTLLPFKVAPCHCFVIITRHHSIASAFAPSLHTEALHRGHAPRLISSGTWPHLLFHSLHTQCCQAWASGCFRFESAYCMCTTACRASPPQARPRARPRPASGAAASPQGAWTRCDCGSCSRTALVRSAGRRARADHRILSHPTAPALGRRAAAARRAAGVTPPPGPARALRPAGAAGAC